MVKQFAWKKHLLLVMIHMKGTKLYALLHTLLYSLFLILLSKKLHLLIVESVMSHMQVLNSMILEMDVSHMLVSSFME